MRRLRPNLRALFSPGLCATLFGIVLAAGAPLDAQARLWTVRKDGTGDFSAIQPAIDASSSGDVVEVGPGVYFEALVFGGRRIELRSSNGPEKTILDGSRETVSIVRLLFSEARSTRIVGFTMRSGRGTPLSEPRAEGAPSSRLEAEPGGGGLRFGGAVLCNPGNATFENVHFVGNMANRGGAFYSGGGGAPLLVDCEFRANVAGEGGALASEFSRPVLDRVEFRENQAVSGGAIHDTGGGLTCRTSVFAGNIASDGGAVYVRDGLGTGRFESCIFSRNLAAEGAGLRIIRATVDVVGSILADNEFPDFDAGQLHYSDASGDLDRNVFYAGPGLTDLRPLLCDQGANLQLTCNLFWPTAPTGTCGDSEENFQLNPLFCRPGFGDYSPRPDSPCLADNAPGSCEGIGPFSEAGCELPLLDVRSLGGGRDTQTMEDRKAEPPR